MTASQVLVPQVQASTPSPRFRSPEPQSAIRSKNEFGDSFQKADVLPELFQQASHEAWSQILVATWVNLFGYASSDWAKIREGLRKEIDLTPTGAERRIAYELAHSGKIVPSKLDIKKGALKELGNGVIAKRRKDGILEFYISEE